MPGHMVLNTADIKEEQIWGNEVNFFEKKLFRNDQIAINLRRIPAHKTIQTEGGYQLHTHDETWEIAYVLDGMHTCFSETLGKVQIGKGQLSVMPPHVKHGAFSVDKELLALVVFTPPPKVRY